MTAGVNAELHDPERRRRHAVGSAARLKVIAGTLAAGIQDGLVTEVERDLQEVRAIIRVIESWSKGGD